MTTVLLSGKIRGAIKEGSQLGLDKYILLLQPYTLQFWSILRGHLQPQQRCCQQNGCSGAGKNWQHLVLSQLYAKRRSVCTVVLGKPGNLRRNRRCANTNDELFRKKSTQLFRVLEEYSDLCLADVNFVSDYFTNVKAEFAAICKNNSISLKKV